MCVNKVPQTFWQFSYPSSILIISVFVGDLDFKLKGLKFCH